MSWKRLAIVTLIIAMVCVCSITGRPLKRAQAATVTNHWTWSFPEDNLTYEVYEYSDCRFTVLETNGGAQRNIVGHPYLTYEGDPRTSVDAATMAYWQQVANNYYWNHIAAAAAGIVGWGAILATPTVIGIAISAAATVVSTISNAVWNSRESHTLTPSDEVEVFYEIAVCNKAACDLALTPGITIPTESIWASS
jgi:hypothetical protein